MKDLPDFSEIEVKLHMTLDAMSNGEAVDVKDEWIEQAGEEFKAAIRRKLEETHQQFKLRMSNIGRPLCQLQNDKAGTDKSRNDYNHFVRMLIGDAVESVIKLVAKAAKINITADAQSVKLQVNDSVVNGTDDLEIGSEVWDVKSASPWAFAHKFMEGWNGVYYQDSFGYVAQLYGYAKARNKKMGGWIVVDKSSGEVKVVHATPTPEQMKHIEDSINHAERAITQGEPFKKCFDPEPEVFKKQLTGNTKLHPVCTFCPYLRTCWPEAVQRPQAFSTASDRKIVWYSQEPTEGL